MSSEYPMSDRAPEILRVGFDDPFVPLAWQAGEAAKGPLLEMAARILSAAGHQAVFVPLTLQSSLSALAEGEVDLLAFKAVVSDRAGVCFTRPLMTTGAALFRLGDGDGSGAAVRAVATPATGPLVGLVQKALPQAVPLLTADYPSALEAVTSGRAEAAALNVHVGWHWAETLYPTRFAFPDALLARLPLAMAVGAQRGADLRDRLDRHIEDLTARGALRAILVTHKMPILD